MPTAEMVTIKRNADLEKVLGDEAETLTVPESIAEILVFFGDYEYVGKKVHRIQTCQSLEQLSSEIDNEVRKWDLS